MTDLVLAYRALKLGDLLTVVPALRALRRAFPDEELVLATPAWLEPVARLTGAVDRIHPVDGLGPLLLNRLPVVAVNLHGRGPQSHRVLLAARPRRLIAFANGEVPESAGMPQWRADEHEVRRWCRLLRESGIPADPDDLRLEPPGPPVGDLAGATVIHPGASSGARRWPPSRWAEVATAEVSAGRRVVVTGTDTEVPLAVAVADLARLPPSAIVAGRTDLLTLARLVAHAGRVLCADTGVAHLATAFGTPSVVVFGPVSPSQWGPPSAQPQHIALWSGQRGDPHAEQVDPGLLRIQPAHVLAALARLDAEPVPA